MKKTGRIYYTQVATTPEGEPVMMGTFLVANHPAVILFDSGASHTFISKKFVEQHCIPYTESREGFTIHSGQKYEENWADLLYASGHDTGRRTGYDGYVSRGQSPCSYSF